AGHVEAGQAGQAEPAGEIAVAQWRDVAAVQVQVQRVDAVACQGEAAFDAQGGAVAPGERGERPVGAKWLVALQAQLDRRRWQGNVGVAGEELAAEQVAFEIEARGSACSAGTVVDDEAATESLPRDARVGRVESGAIDG